MALVFAHKRSGGIKSTIFVQKGYAAKIKTHKMRFSGSAKIKTGKIKKRAKLEDTKKYIGFVIFCCKILHNLFLCFVYDTLVEL